MLKRLDLQVSFDTTSVVFTFPMAVHILTFAVSAQTGEILWKLLPEGAQPVSTDGGRFWSKPLGDEIISTDYSDASGFIEVEHVVPILKSITYDAVPNGYEAPIAPPLLRGESYHVVFMAEEGHGGMAFMVGDASSNGCY